MEEEVVDAEKRGGEGWIYKDPPRPGAYGLAEGHYYPLIKS